MSVEMLRRLIKLSEEKYKLNADCPQIIKEKHFLLKSGQREGFITGAQEVINNPEKYIEGYAEMERLNFKKHKTLKQKSMNLLKCKVVMLPQNQRAIFPCIAIGTPELGLRYTDRPFGMKSTKYYHLCLISSRDIKAGDLMYDYFFEKAKVAHELDSLNTGQKIEATTDRELWIKRPMEDPGHFLNKPLPLIPESFVEKYVQQQGKIKEVLVEVYDHAALFLGYETGDIKTRPDGTCIIHKVKDNWNKEELKEACWKAYRDSNTVWKADDEGLKEEFEKWFNEKI